ncbi:hypothetical protein MYIN104542_14710 [Mycobacterium intermedium]
MNAVAAADKRVEITVNPVSEVVELADSDEGRSTSSNEAKVTQQSSGIGMRP